MSRRVEEMRLATAAKKGSVDAIKRLGELASIQSSALERFPRIFPILTSSLASQKVPPETPIDWSQPGIYDSHFAIACFRSLTTAFHTSHALFNERAEVQLIREHWSAIRRWIIFLIGEVAPAFKREGTQLQLNDVGRYEVWVDIWQFMRAFHDALRTVEALDLVWTSDQYIRSVFYMWMAQAQHIDAETADLKDPETEHFIANTVGMGLMFTGMGEASYDSVILDFPQFANYLGKPLLLAIRMSYPHLQFLTCTLAIISESEDHFNPLTFAERDRLASNVIRSIRHMLLRLNAAHTPLETTILPAMECAGIALSSLIQRHEQYHIAFLAGLLNTGIFPVLRRLTLLNTCQCSDEYCAWTAVPFRYFELEDSAWSAVIRLIPLVIYRHGGNVALFGQLRRGIRWMARDQERCEKADKKRNRTQLQPREWATWASVLNAVNQSLAVRDQFEKRPSKLCCGPKCSSPAMPAKMYKLCAGCNEPSYCSQRCQKEDWISAHRRVCTPGNDICQYPSTPSSIDIACLQWQGMKRPTR